jgi:hypothetical protein
VWSSHLTSARLELRLAAARYRTRPVREKGFARLFDIRGHAIHRTSFGLLSGHRHRRRMLCPASISNITANKRVHVVHESAAQVVMLGAGMDTRACRLKWVVRKRAMDAGPSRAFRAARRPFRARF